MAAVGEIRAALRQAADRQIAAGISVVTYRSLAASAGVGWKSAQATVREMSRWGDLVPVGPVRTGRRGRPAMGYQLRAELRGVAAGQALAETLPALIRGWSAVR